MGPMPLTMPLPRYFSMPSLLVGAVLLRVSARNWGPNSRSCTQRPSAVIHSPGVTAGREPTTVTWSRCPLTFTLRTAKPFSSLKKVTRSIKPERLSGGAEVGSCNCGHGGMDRQMRERNKVGAVRRAPTKNDRIFTYTLYLWLLILCCCPEFPMETGLWDESPDLETSAASMPSVKLEQASHRFGFRPRVLLSLLMGSPQHLQTRDFIAPWI